MAGKTTSSMQYTRVGAQFINPPTVTTTTHSNTLIATPSLNIPLGVNLNWGTAGTMASSKLAPVKGRGWPRRHSHRCYWYHKLLRLHSILAIPMQEETYFKKDPTIFLKYWTEHEVEIIERCRKDLAELYNNRFFAYKQMIAKEKGFECPEVENTNKFILK